MTSNNDTFLTAEALVENTKGEFLLYLRCDPPINDFTKIANYQLLITTKTTKQTIRLNAQLNYLCNLLKATVFTEDKKVIFWDVKPFITFLKMNTKSDNLKNTYFDNIIDLSCLERYNNIHENAPKTWQEALQRTKSCLETPDLMKVYKKTHLPLLTKVIPDIESCGIVDVSKKHQPTTLYPHYVVEGQSQGRLSCHMGSTRFVNPHSLDQPRKETLIPRHPFTHFVQMDYKAMEVVILQWLSKDENLKTIIEHQDKDIYTELFKFLIGQDEVSKEQRQMAKTFFLPVFYGMQSYALSQVLGIDKELSQAIIDLIKEKFSTAWQWVDQQHQVAQEKGEITDFFSRTKKLDTNHYLARHFCIAAPAATICLNKLIDLHQALNPEEAKIVFSVHDGYLVSTRKEHMRKVAHKMKSVLEGEIIDCPDLKLKTSCEIGTNLGKMKQI